MIKQTLEPVQSSAGATTALWFGQPGFEYRQAKYLLAPSPKRRDLHWGPPDLEFNG